MTSAADRSEDILHLWQQGNDTRFISVHLGFPESEVYNLLAELRDLILESDRRERYDLSPEVRA